jgi:hypothetical protein
MEDSINVLAAVCSPNNHLAASSPAKLKASPHNMTLENPMEDNENDGPIYINIDSDSAYQSDQGPDSLSKSPSRGKWSAEEDDLLREAVEKYGGKNWKKISDLLVGRTDVQCLHRWQKVLRPGLVKGPWTQEVGNLLLLLLFKQL